MRTIKKNVLMFMAVTITIALMGGFSPATAQKTIVFADFGWDSVQVHNRIAGFIIEKGLGYPIKFTQGETVMLNTALIRAKGAEAPMSIWKPGRKTGRNFMTRGLPRVKMPEPMKGS